MFIQLLSHKYANYFCQQLFKHLPSDCRAEILKMMIVSISMIAKNKKSLCSFVALLENFLNREDQIHVVNLLVPYLNDLLKSRLLSRVFEAIVGNFESDVSYNIRLFIVKNIYLLKNNKDQYFLIRKLILKSKDAQIFLTLCKTISDSLAQFISRPYGSLICSELINTIDIIPDFKFIKKQCIMILLNSIETEINDLCNSRFSYKLLLLILSSEKFHASFIKIFKHSDLNLIASSKFGGKLLYHAYHKFDEDNKTKFLNILTSFNYLHSKILIEFVTSLENPLNSFNERKQQFKPFSQNFALEYNPNNFIPIIVRHSPVNLLYIPLNPAYKVQNINPIIWGRSYKFPDPVYSNRSEVNPQLANYLPNYSNFNLFNNTFYEFPDTSPRCNGSK